MSERKTSRVQEIELSSGFVLVDDGELTNPWAEKSKGGVCLREALDAAYQDERGRKALKGLHEELLKYKDLGIKLRNAKGDYRGCKLSLDAWYYGLPILSMVFDLATKNVTSDTLFRSAEISAIMAGVLFAFNVVAKSNETKDEPVKSTYQIFAESKAIIKDLQKQIGVEGRKINTYMRVLGLDEAEELQEKYDMAWLVTSVGDFFEEKGVEEEIRAKYNLAE